jgi:hypothetical protein
VSLAQSSDNISTDFTLILSCNAVLSIICGRNMPGSHAPAT